jgi:hypothetical protein
MRIADGSTSCRAALRLGLAAALCLAMAGPLVAQDRAGLTLGASLSALYGDDVVARGDSRWGFYGGAYGETQVADFIALSLGVNYEQKGGEGLLGTALLESERLELDVNYVELPFLIELTLPLGRPWELIAYGGIAAAFNVSCKAALAGGEKQSCKDTPLGGPKMEWGLPAGGGLSYTLDDGEMIVFEARYTWGLNEVVSDADVRTRAWYFLIRLVKPT